jgi:Flp pilus assembly secretin CpaC
MSRSGRIAVRHIARACLIASTMFFAGAQAIAASGIDVVMNQAKILKLARPADTIVIGNPAIADASVQDSTTIVLTGRGFGVTNLVVLDVEGNPIVDEQVIVSRDSPHSVRVYRRANVQTLSCTPYCESSYKSEAERTSELEMSAGGQ